MFRADRLEPIGTLVGRAIHRLDAFRGKPIGAFPSTLGSVHGILGHKSLMDGAAAQTTNFVKLTSGRTQGIVLAVHLDRPRVKEGTGVVVIIKTPDIERPNVEAGTAVDDPLRHHFTSTTTGSDAISEARVDVGIFEFGVLSHHEISISRDRDGAVDQLVNAHLVQDRNALGREEAPGLEPIPIARQQLAPKVLADAILPEGLGALFPTPDGESTHVRLEVNQMVRITHGWQVVGQIGNPLGDHELMFDRDRWSSHSHHPAEFPSPHPGAVHHHLAPIGGLVGDHFRDSLSLPGESRHALTLIDLRPTTAGALGESLGQAGGIDITV